jgi:hypothetical protein
MDADAALEATRSCCQRQDAIFTASLPMTIVALV